jgi:hypothetical protein
MQGKAPTQVEQNLTVFIVQCEYFVSCLAINRQSGTKGIHIAHHANQSWHKRACTSTTVATPCCKEGVATVVPYSRQHVSSESSNDKTPVFPFMLHASAFTSMWQSAHSTT